MGQAGDAGFVSATAAVTGTWHGLGREPEDRSAASPSYAKDPKAVIEDSRRELRAFTISLTANA